MLVLVNIGSGRVSEITTLNRGLRSKKLPNTLPPLLRFNILSTKHQFSPHNEVVSEEIRRLGCGGIYDRLLSHFVHKMASFNGLLCVCVCVCGFFTPHAINCALVLHL